MAQSKSSNEIKEILDSLQNDLGEINFFVDDFKTKINNQIDSIQNDLERIEYLIDEDDGSDNPTDPDPEIPEGRPLLVSPSDNEVINSDSNQIFNIKLKWLSRGANDKYDLRVADLSDNSIRMPGNDCGVDKYYVCRNNLKNNEFTLPVVPNHRYRWWVHIHGKLEATVGFFSVGQESGSNPTPPEAGFYRGLMLTDAVCDKNLAQTRGDEIAYLRTKYDTILTLIDLQRNGPVQTRNYVDWARNKDKLTSLGLNNLKWLHDQGFRVHAILLNGWGARHNFAGQMGSVQDALINESTLYTNKQLEVEKAFIDDLLSKAGDYIDGIMPVLEGSHAASALFTYRIAEYLREQKKFKGAIIFNNIGDGANETNKYDLKKYNILKAVSQNSLDTWEQSDNDIRNADGMLEINSSRTDAIQKVTGKPGPNGFYLWAKELVGSNSGPTSNIPTNYVEYAVLTDGGNNGGDNGDGDDTLPEWEGLREAKELQKHMLWKPISESDSKLVVLVKWSIRDIKRVALRNSWLGDEFEEGRHTGEFHDGREVFRFKKSGGEYPKPVYLSFTMKNSDAYIFKIPNGSNRYEETIAPYHFPASGSSGDNGGGNNGGGNNGGGGIPPVTGALFPMQPSMWGEARRGWGNYANGLYKPVLMVLDGLVSGAVNLKIIHPWYDPWKQPVSESYIRNWARKAVANEGFQGVGLDHEGWCLQDPNILRWLYEAVAEVGGVFVNVPKITLDHQASHWKWSVPQVVSWMEKYTHASAGWIYNFHGQHYESVIKKTWMDNGYTKQVFAMGDEGNRPHYGGITPEIAANTVNYLADRGISFSLFNPKDPNSKAMQALKARYRGIKARGFLPLQEHPIDVDINAPCNAALGAVPHGGLPLGYVK